MANLKVFLFVFLCIAFNAMFASARPEPEKAPQQVEAEASSKADDLEPAAEEKDLKSSSSYGFGYYGGYPYYGYGHYPYGGFGGYGYGLYGHGYPYYGGYNSHFFY